jgi:stage V sporulation protein D (sporulation-specific penicillin-binding protein)
MNHSRVNSIEIGFVILLVVVIGRLFYWQIFSGPALQAIAQTQHQSVVEVPASRGKILASDGFPLVNNQAAYTTFAYTPDLEESADIIAQTLSPLLAPRPEDVGATPSAEIAEKLVFDTAASISAKLTARQSSWIPLARNTLEAAKQTIQTFNYKGIGFEESEIRQYPEASMAAQVLGFVGSDGSGRPKGYFGLEGRYNFELTGRPGLIRQEKDALGKPIVTGEYADIKHRDGRTLKTHIDRGLQFVVERELKKGIEKYQAMSGEITIIDPQTGGILAMASYPSFDPSRHKLYEPETYKNPAITDTYEPGSTFKTVVMAAAVNEGVISPETRCNKTCDGPVTIGKYSIKTWNNEYNPGQTMTEVLERSDNTGMIFVANSLGKDKFIDYLGKFGFGATTNVDLEGETSPKLRQKWGDIDVATASFGQGLAVNSMQMVMAVGAIANQGKLMEPHVVSAVIDGDSEVQIAPKVVRQVISKEAAATVTQMMRESARHGDAKWAVPQELDIAGKTGTAQVAIAGHYDATKTIASFIGFAPASNPKFVMLVKLREPQSSPWASETAAPLWFSLAQQMFRYFNIPTITIDNRY